MKKRIALVVLALLMVLVQMPVSAQDELQKELILKQGVPIYEEVLSQNGSEQDVPGADRMDEEKPEKNEKSFSLRRVEVEEITDGENTIYIDKNAAVYGEPFTEDDLLVRNILLEGILAYEISINLDDYDITTEDLNAYLQDIGDSEAMIYHVEKYRYSMWDDYVGYVFPVYSMTKEEYEQSKVFVDKEVGAIIEESGALHVDDDFTKALVLHDYIANHYAYDDTYSYFDIYSMLKRGEGVCQAYTLLYDEVLTRCGIEVSYAQSDDMNHIWNIVKIDESYYHVDLTWDVSIGYGMVYHTYFMISDGEMLKNAHYNWLTFDDIKCTDTRYDKITLSSIVTSVYCYEGEIYYIDKYEANLCRYQDHHSGGIVLYHISDAWKVAGRPGYIYSVNYSSLVGIDEKLYFNVADAIKVYNLETKEVSEVLSMGDDDRQICGIKYAGENRIAYKVAADPIAEVSEICYYELPKEVTFAPCDVNHDGVLNVDDLNCMLICLVDASYEEIWFADVNGNGLVNVEDLNLVLIALATE